MTLMYLAMGRSPTIASSSTLVLRSAGDLPSWLPSSSPLRRRPTAHGPRLRDVIRKAKRDRASPRLMISPAASSRRSGPRCRRSAKRSSTFEQSGKPVYAFLEYGGGKEYHLASAADKVYLLPTSTLDLTGMPSYEVFLRGTFDWVGTYPDFLHVGDFKTAINTFTEKSSRPRTAR